jgi:RNA polymerase sigma factor (sigma-70 family)
MDTELERDDFDRVATIEELEASEALDVTSAEAAAAAQPDEDDILGEGIKSSGDQESGYGTYGAVIRQRPLLTAEQEKELGERLLVARLEMTEALSVLPAMVAQLCASWDEALAGERPISEVLQWPLGEPRKDEGGGKTSATVNLSPRERMKLMHEKYSRWRDGRARRAATGAGRCPPALKALFNETAPAFAMLCELRESAQELATELDGIKGRSAAARRHRASVEDRAGIDGAGLRKAVARAATAERRFQASRRVMFESNIRLVFYIAGKFVNNGLTLDDLVQEGSIGLLRAVEKFDHRLGYKFSTYASTWIWQAVTRAIANQRRTVRVPAHLHDKMLKVRSAAAAFEQRNGRAPNMDELIKETDMPAATVRRALDASRSALSLDAPIAAAESTTFGELTPDRSLRDAHEPVFENELTRKLEDLLSDLPPREAMILRLRHGLGGTESHTLEEIGALLSITRERTRQLQNRALKSLKERLDPRLAEAFAE